MAGSYQEIQAQIRELTAAAETARRAELDHALTTIRELIQQYDLTQEDVLSLFKKRRGGSSGAKAEPANKGAPKYRDPETGRTWSGQGRAPNWIKDAPDSTAFLIEGAGAPAAKKSRGRGGQVRGATKRVGRRKAA